MPSTVIIEIGETNYDKETKNDKEDVIWWWDASKFKIHKDEIIPLNLTEFKPNKDKVNIIYGYKKYVNNYWNYFTIDVIWEYV